MTHYRYIYTRRFFDPVQTPKNINTYICFVKHLCLALMSDTVDVIEAYRGLDRVSVPLPG